MTEYIDKIAFRAAIDGIHPFTKDGQRDPKWNYAKKEFLSALARFPAADVVERKIGKWITYLEDGFVECPFCHSATNCDGEVSELHYCFNCGAELDG